MAYTVTELITTAWNLSSIVAAQAETVSGDQLTTGLDHLNDFLALQSTEFRMIPYTRVHSFECKAKCDEFLIDHLLKVDVLTIKGNGDYPLQPQGRKAFFSQPCQHYSPSQPRAYHIEPAKGGSLLFLSPTPDKSYQFRLVGKFGLAEVDYNDDLSKVYDRFYLLYLRYGLADYLCDLYNHPFSGKGKLSELESKLRDYSPLDLSVEKISYFNAETP